MQPSGKLSYNIKYGPISVDKAGASYNMVMNGKKYLIQQMWDPEKQKCTMKP